MQPDWTSIDAVILDLGGVILNIDYHRTIRAFQSLGFQNFDEQYSQLKQSGLFDELETGAINQSQFVQRIQESIPEIEATHIIDAWNALLLDFPAGRIETVRQISRAYPTFLLSNTNEIHLKAFNQILQDEEGIEGIEPLFKKAYLSHEIQLRKPDPRAFQVILEEQQLIPNRTLFVDDSPQHIEAANQLGIQTFHMVHPHSLEELFRPILTELN